MVGVAEAVLVGVRLALGCGVAEGADPMAVPLPSGIAPAIPPAAEHAVSNRSSSPAWMMGIIFIGKPERVIVITS